ncbi:amino acid adenylation domain-containing protein [Aeromonas salmonicida]|uniref:amino acid adenylation domain-containing protein n=1 Tax=Aeromonas salmonicida TaxID=645 RepID=UPI0012D97C38|nr:amino acid adenylation domain-containing protein [Aeromonas salmonicida]MUG29400.1 amino acid adenylation domain-containing protein [Aeromonas salmonicida]
MRELTSMQAACWIGRGNHSALGEVSAHLYAEFDCHTLDLQRLGRALEHVYRSHHMLRLQITHDGMQTVAEMAPSQRLEVDDFKALGDAERAEALRRKRQEWTHQRLDLARGQAARFSVSLLREDACRLHIDTDMIAVDPSSFRVLMEDLALFYECPDSPRQTPPAFFDWCDAINQDPVQQAARMADRAWWRSRLSQIAPAPSLPAPAHAASSPDSHRLSAWLSPEERQTLIQLARHRRMTPSSLMLGLFAHQLGMATGDTTFRLNLPFFWRQPVIEGTEQIVGEFANLTILDVDMTSANTLAGLCHQLASQMAERLSHGSYSGVNLMRDISRHHGAAQLAPVVFTAALDLDGGELFSERVHSVFGSMNWVISQGPQVALDAQVVRIDGGILINWDIRLDALPQAWITRLFNDFVTQVRTVATNPATLDQALTPQKPLMETPLTPLQRAYLLGRTTQFPLGGVAMQEFREYCGRLDPATLRQRLHAMVKRHESLRTLVDPERVIQYVSDEERVNLEEIDLRHLSAGTAQERLELHRNHYTHALFSLDHAPWNLTLFHLPDDQHVVFARFDALILDGRSIAALMLELFEGHQPDMPSITAAQDAPVSPELRKADAQYWTHKLAGLDGAPRLPWKQPLDQIPTARYERQSLIIPPDLFTPLCKLGSRQHFFKNTTIMALILDVLSRWLDEGDLCVAIPVAPLPSGPLANRSSFIAVEWCGARDTLIDRANQLQNDVMEGLQHLAFSGVDIARQLFETRGTGPVLPIVITNGLSWPTATGSSTMTLCAGLTQTPQVAMDIRFSSRADGALVLDIDYAREAIESDLVCDILTALDKASRHIVTSGLFDIDASAIIDTGHYRHNSDETGADTDPFLERIAAHLFDAGNDEIALIQGDRRISYRTLGDSVLRIMGAFEREGITAGKVVAICLPRSPEHTMATLACALSGVVWVPIDSCSPTERLHYLLENCRPDLIICADGIESDYPTVTPAALLASPHDNVCGAPWVGRSQHPSPAYYLYTSGTTGKPKCVVLNNRATANVIGSTLKEWQVTPDDVFISVTPLHHDMSVFDVFGCLSAGATLVQPETGAEKDAVRWNQLVKQHGVTLWCSVPAMLEMLLSCSQATGLASLRLIAQGGDYIKPGIIAELRKRLPSARLASLGGPTETTIWSIWHQIGVRDQDKIPYGTPLPGNGYWLLNERGEHCPTGVAGRIHTTGVNLALGYLEDGELTQQDFVTLASDSGEETRAFRTGDRGRYRADGTLMFDSRVNGYIKVRGVRVSLPDIEIELIKHPAIAHVLVVDYGAEQQGELCIGALYVGKHGDTVSITSLREHAKQHLPASHVPTRFIQVDSLPLTQNGKPDRRAARSRLTSSDKGGSAPQATADAGATDGGAVLDIYLEVLGQVRNEGMSSQLDFTSLGLRPQHLKVISARLGEHFSRTLSPGQLLRCRNAADVEVLLRSPGS